jgi:flagellar protein FliO/FliZ
MKIIGLVALVVSLTLPCFADNATGQLIDEMIKKDSGAVVTAEDALPGKKSSEAKSEAKVDPKNLEAAQPVFNNPTSVAAITKHTEKSLWGRMFISLFIVLVIFGGAFVAYRRWPGSKKIAQRAKMIEVLTQQYLGPKRSLAVIRVAGEAVLIGVTDTNITLLKTLSLLDDDVPTETKDARFVLKNNENQKFQNTLGKKVKAETTSREDEFSMQGLKEIIGDRLKNMREI